MTDPKLNSSQKSVQAILADLADQKITVHLREGEKLFVQAPKGVMDADIAARIKNNKRDIVAFLRSADAGLISLVPIQSGGDKRPFFCIHGGAGHVFHYQPWSLALGETRPFYGLQPKMSETDQTRPAFLTVEEMAAHYVREIQTVQPTGPYLLGGFCFGGIVAFEMAQQLLRSGQEVATLVLIDATLPVNWPEMLSIVPPPAVRAKKQKSPWLQRHWRHLALLGWQDKGRYLFKTAQNRRRSWWTNSGKWHFERFGGRLLQLYLVTGRPVPARLRDFYFMNLVTPSANDYYFPQQYDGQLIFFYSKLAAELPIRWQRLLRKEMENHYIDANHLGMLQPPAIEQIAAILKPRLALTD